MKQTALPPEDQKRYAEIVYSWLINRIKSTKSSFNYDDYLFCVGTDPPYDEQFVLFIAAEKNQVRGTGRGEIYPIGNLHNMKNAVDDFCRRQNHSTTLR